MATGRLIDEVQNLLGNGLLRRFNNGKDLKFAEVDENEARIRVSIYECLEIELEFVDGAYMFLDVMSVLYFANSAERIRCRQELGLTGTVIVDLVRSIAYTCLKHFRERYPTVIISLQDDSKLRFVTQPAENPDDEEVIEIPFAILKLLAEGRSWYNQHGFIAAKKGAFPFPDPEREARDKADLELIRHTPSSFNPSLTNAEQARMFLDALKTLPVDAPLSDEDIILATAALEWVEQFVDTPRFRYTRNLSMQISLARPIDGATTKNKRARAYM